MPLGAITATHQHGLNTRNEYNPRYLSLLFIFATLACFVCCPFASMACILICVVSVALIANIMLLLKMLSCLQFTQAGCNINNNEDPCLSMSCALIFIVLSFVIGIPSAILFIVAET